MTLYGNLTAKQDDVALTLPSDGFKFGIEVPQELDGSKLNAFRITVSKLGSFGDRIVFKIFDSNFNQIAPEFANLGSAQFPTTPQIITIPTSSIQLKAGDIVGIESPAIAGGLINIWKSTTSNTVVIKRFKSGSIITGTPFPISMQIEVTTITTFIPTGFDVAVSATNIQVAGSQIKADAQYSLTNPPALGQKVKFIRRIRKVGSSIDSHIQELPVTLENSGIRLFTASPILEAGTYEVKFFCWGAESPNIDVPFSEPFSINLTIDPIAPPPVTTPTLAAQFSSDLNRLIIDFQVTGQPSTQYTYRIIWNFGVPSLIINFFTDSTGNFTAHREALAVRSGTEFMQVELFLDSQLQNFVTEKEGTVTAVIPQNDEVNTSMIDQSIGVFKLENGTVTGEILYNITNTFNPFWYGKTILSILEFRDLNNQPLKIKNNDLMFTETERDEKIMINEFVGVQNVTIFFHVTTTDTQRFFSERKLMQIQEGAPSPPPPTTEKKIDYFKVATGIVFGGMALSLIAPTIKRKVRTKSTNLKKKSFLDRLKGK